MIRRFTELSHVSFVDIHNRAPLSEVHTRAEEISKAGNQEAMKVSARSEVARQTSESNDPSHRHLRTAHGFEVMSLIVRRYA